MPSSMKGCERITKLFPVIGFKILGAEYLNTDDVWFIELTVANQTTHVAGFAFRSRDFTEIRFESVNTNDSLSLIENNSLYTLLDVKCPGRLEQLEDLVREFVDESIFCVKTLIDVNEDISHSCAISYKWSGIVIPITGD